MEMGENFAVLVAFGKLLSPHRESISSGRLFSLLAARKIWYLPRPSAYCKPGRSIVFYENSVGIRGYARIASVGTSNSDDSQWLRGIGAEPFGFRISLQDAHIFERAVSLRPLVRDLSFIKNKEFWGQSLRTTPRLLSPEDFELIRRSAALESEVRTNA